MERLTKRIKEENRVVYTKAAEEIDGNFTTVRKKQKIAYEVLCRLAELEDKNESGLLLELPCMRKIERKPTAIYEVVFVQIGGTIASETYPKPEQAEQRLAELKK